MSGRSWRIAVLLALPAALLALFAIPLSGESFGLQLGTLVVVYALAVVGLDAVAGRGGQLHVGYAVIFGAGAYTTAIYAREVDGPAILAVLCGVVVGAAVSTILGLLLSRSAGYMFAVLTLAASTALASVVNNVQWLGGTSGVGGVSRDLFGTGAIEPEALYVMICAITAIVIALYARFRRTATGRAIEAMRLVPGVAQASGVDIARLRVRLSVLSGAIGGLAGTMYALLQQYVSADLVGATSSVNLLAMNIIGGSTVALAGVPGAFIVIGLPQMIQSLVSYQLIMVGVITGVIALWLRRGLAGTPLDLWARAVRPLLERPPGSSDDERPATMPRRPAEPVRGTLTAEQVSVEFDGVIALGDVSIGLMPGRVHALVGPNGAGKTTLVNVLAGSQRPTRGTVRLDGDDIVSLSAHRRAKAGITRTFQIVALCGTLSVRENVMLGGFAHQRPSFVRDFFGIESRAAERTQRQRAEALLDALGAAELADRRVDALTSGQRRLVEIARCLMTDAEVILLDEPAAGLSSSERRQLAKVIRRLASEGKAILLIEHDMEFVMSLAEEITVLTRGTRLASGAPDAVRADPRVIEAYWGTEVAA
jgi:branched-chain amino acid transport system permease protein